MRVAKAIEQKGQLIGARAAKKTMLASQVLSEFNAGGRVWKKTMLAVDDAARSAEDVYTGKITSAGINRRTHREIGMTLRGPATRVK